MKFTSKTIARSAFLLLICLVCTTRAFSQQRTINGKVRTADNVPLSNVSVLLKGTNIGSQTNDDGQFQISVPNDGILIFSIIG